MTKIIVDGTEVDVPPEYTLLQACEAAGAEIPRFCFHERLSIAGNCRMCLVELKGAPKPIASCAWGVRDCRPGPNGEAPTVVTKSDLVRKARHGVMEFLLINHPLDCPICDQGGECDLQDQAMAFGVAGSRFHENKRAVEDKYIGPLVRTSMNRCIHCTRCVRFTAEVAGTGDMGSIGRGEDMEITTYLESSLGSELQSNIADLCPVGALLPKPYPFKARPWEMTKTEGIDVMDALGSNIRIDSRGREVLRILPRINDDVNEEWISDKTRHIADGLKTQRLDRPYVRQNGRLVAVSWQEAFRVIAARVKATTPQKIGAIAGDLASVEDMYGLKGLMERLGSPNIDCRQDGSRLHPRFGRGSYLFNATVAGIESADSLLIIGSNPRKESPVLNARIRKRWLSGNFPIELIGQQADLTYAYKYLGAGPGDVDRLCGQGRGARRATPRHRRAGGAGAGGRSRDRVSGRESCIDSDRRQGWVERLLPSSIRQHRASAASTSASCPGRAGSTLRRWRLQAGSTFCSCSAPTRSTSRPAPSWSTRARTAIAALIGRMSSCRAPPIPRCRASMSTWKAACRCRSGPTSLRAKPARTGPCCGPCPRCSGPSCRSIRSRRFGRHSGLTSRFLQRPIALRHRPRLTSAALRAGEGGAGKAAFGSAVPDFYLTNPICRASAVMAECSALAGGRLRQAAE